MNERLSLILNRLNNRTELQALTPTRIWDTGLDAQIASLDSGKPAAALDRTLIALLAGLHLRNDSLDASHAYAQQIEDDPTGSYWHGLMHRMEQDYWNSQYWFRQAGQHPVKAAMKAQSAAFLLEQVQLDSLSTAGMTDSLLSFRDRQGWNTDTFVDLIKLQEQGQGTEDTRRVLEQLQRLEIAALFQFTYKAAKLDRLPL